MEYISDIGFSSIKANGYDGTMVLSSNVQINRGCFSSPPKVIPEPSLTLDQQCDAARSRLRVSIEANYAYTLKQWKESFVKNKQIRKPAIRKYGETEARILTVDDVLHDRSFDSVDWSKVWEYCAPSEVEQEFMRRGINYQKQ